MDFKMTPSLAATIKDQKLKIIRVTRTKQSSAVVSQNTPVIVAPATNKKFQIIRVIKPISLNAAPVVRQNGSHHTPATKQVLQEINNVYDITQTPTANNNNFEVRIPKPLKRHAKVVDENGHQVVIPPAPSKRQAAVIPQPTVPLIQVNNTPAFNNLSALPCLPVKLHTPEVKKFHATKNLTEATDFSPVPNLKPAFRKTKLSLSKKGISSSATTTAAVEQNPATTPTPTGKQDKILLPEKKNFEDCSNVPESISSATTLPLITVEQNDRTSPATTPTGTQDTIIFPEEKNYEEILQEMMPHPYTSYNHKIESIGPLKPYHKKPEYDQSEMFTATIRLNLRSKEEALQWLQDFQDSSLSDWRVRKCFKENTKCLIFKKGFRCSHNTQAQYRKKKTKPHKKHTKCDAYLSITVKNFKMKRSKDKLLKTHPCVIVLHNCHNHPIDACDVLRFRRPSPKVVKIFLEMFRKEHSPSSALSTYQYDVQNEHPNNWFEILADGAECPNLQWCYHLYYKTFLKEYGPPSGEGMVQSLFAAIDKYNAESGSICAAATKFQETDLIVAICSPLMKRVHKYLKSSGEINFLDSGGSMDRHNSRVFTFLAPSVAGALPLGIIFSSSESEDVLKKGMELLQSIMPDGAFFGRGPSKGPQVIMTDDSTAERNTLTACFPDIILLLCFFHILQAYWTYVWNYKHNVKAEEKEEVFFIFKDWCYSETQEEFEKGFHGILGNPLYSKNPLLIKHVKGLFDRASEWALCYRTELLIRGNNTNNYSEITIRQFKDQVLHRLKAYSVVQLFDFFTTRLESYFERRIAAVVNNRKENYYTSKHYIPPSKLVPLECAKSSHEHMYLVKNVEKGTKYTVDMQLEICSCPVGFNGAPCKHQFAVAKTFNLSTSQFLPYEDKAAKLILHQIMTTALPKPGWYASLNGGPVISTTEAELDAQSTSTGAALEDEADMGDCDNTLQIQASTGTSESDKPYPEEETERLLELWESVNLFVTNGLKERPEVFGSAVDKFASKFNQAKALSENVVLSAMHTFSINSFGSKSVKKGRYCKVNTAAVIRRKYASMAGRKVTQQGRPAKSAFTKEHGYSVNRQVIPSWNRCNQKKGPVPHKLSQRVQVQSQGSRKRQIKVSK